MRKAIVLGSLAWLMVSVSGCGSASDQVIKDQIQAMNDLADAMEAKAPLDQVTELQNRLREATEKWKALNLSESARKDLLVKHQAELTKAGMRLVQASMGRAVGEMKSLTSQFPELPNAGKLPRHPGAAKASP